MRNEKTMRRYAGNLIEFGTVAPMRIMTWFHTGTVRKNYGGAVGIPVDTGEARGGARARRGALPTFKPPPEASFYPIAGTDHIDAQGAGALGDPWYWRDQVDHAAVLQGGRRWSSALGRMVGSEQATDGFLSQSAEEAAKRLGRWRFRPSRRAA